MRSTILFLTLLVFISCTATEIDSYDTVLLEMAKDVRAEAIFATMSVQLQQSSGFDRVVALLNTLVDDARKQVSDTNKLWNKTKARCEVATMKFKERQDFYTSRQQRSDEYIKTAKEQKLEAESLLQFLGTSSTWFTEFQGKAKQRHAEDTKTYEANINTANSAIKLLDETVKTVDDWKVGSTAFVQTNLEKISGAYQQLKSYKINIPQSFVELAATDIVVRQRLLEWLGAMRLTLLEARTNYENKLNEERKVWDEMETKVASLLQVYEADTKFANEHITLFETVVTNITKNLDLYTSLVTENQKVIESNSSYCSTEKTNYEHAKAVADEQLALFKDVRNYFRTNYSKISKFVREKYNSSTTQ